MATTIEKLQLTLNTKNAIKEALKEKGLDVENKLFSEYPEMIKLMSGGDDIFYYYRDYCFNFNNFDYREAINVISDYIPDIVYNGNVYLIINCNLDALFEYDTIEDVLNNNEYIIVNSKNDIINYLKSNSDNINDAFLITDNWLYAKRLDEYNTFLFQYFLEQGNDFYINSLSSIKEVDLTDETSMFLSFNNESYIHSMILLNVFLGGGTAEEFINVIHNIYPSWNDQETEDKIYEFYEFALRNKQNSQPQ